MSESLIFFISLQHRVRISYLFYCSPRSCLDPLSFQRLSIIMYGSPIFLAAIRHRIKIPYHFFGSSASCLDPLSFQRLSGTVFGSPTFLQFFGIMFESPILLATLRHHVWILIILAAFQNHVWIPYHFGSSLASCPDPLSFRKLSGIVFGSPIFSMALWHCVGSPIILTVLRHHVLIPYLFGGSPTSCRDPLSFRRLSDIVSKSPIILATL